MQWQAQCRSSLLKSFNLCWHVHVWYNIDAKAQATVRYEIRTTRGCADRMRGWLGLSPFQGFVQKKVQTVAPRGASKQNGSGRRCDEKWRTRNKAASRSRSLTGRSLSPFGLRFLRLLRTVLLVWMDFPLIMLVSARTSEANVSATLSARSSRQGRSGLSS